jgi:hypothetical protein
MKRQQLTDDAKQILIANDMGGWTRPTGNGLYPHQWLWDSFFVAIGQRHYDVERAKNEVRSPFRAQWKNGMLPHIIFGDAKGYHAGPDLWRCERSPDAPDHIQTSGVTQPPMAAEAVVRVGELLTPKERRAWYTEMYPRLLRYHQWFYRERDERDDGMVVSVLSWETGMDNSPPWMEMLHQYAVGKRLELAKTLGMEQFITRFRKDTKVVPAKERISTFDLYAVYDLIKNLRRFRYSGPKMHKKHKMQVVDLTLNCILIRANQHLKAIAEAIGETLPADIRHAMRVAPHGLETMWDDETEQYYSRDAISGHLIKVPHIGTFMPLYAQELPKERVQVLRKHLHDPETYGAPFPVPSAPLNSPYFKPHCYWQGPTWVNMNWLIINGLERNHQSAEAAELRQKTIDMIAKSGFYEYFSPLDVTKAGADTFSWTAALLIDLVQPKK